MFFWYAYHKQEPCSVFDDQVTLSPLSLCPFFGYWMDKALLQMIKSYKLESLQSSIISFKSEILDLDLISCFKS